MPRRVDGRLGSDDSDTTAAYEPTHDAHQDQELHHRRACVEFAHRQPTSSSTKVVAPGTTVLDTRDGDMREPDKEGGGGEGSERQGVRGGGRGGGGGGFICQMRLRKTRSLTPIRTCAKQMWDTTETELAKEGKSTSFGAVTLKRLAAVN